MNHTEFDQQNSLAEPLDEEIDEIEKKSAAVRIKLEERKKTLEEEVSRIRVQFDQEIDQIDNLLARLPKVKGSTVSERILKCLLENGPMTSSDLAKHSLVDATKATVRSMCSHLRAQGKIDAFDHDGINFYRISK